jgi:methylated-DNA-[protein]-cysteine S-methyltransferase
MKRAAARRAPDREELYVTGWGVGSVMLRGDVPLALELPDARRARPARGEGLPPSRWRRRLERYFAGEQVEFALDAQAFARELGCTRFETEVYAALATVPYGEVVSYRDLAVLAGRPNAYRAVGSAMARNPLPVILPCHRVIKNDGHCGPYGDDPSWKPRLLALEGLRVDPSGRVTR